MLSTSPSYIRERESSSKDDQIRLYRDDLTDLWYSFGYSAYCLCLQAQKYTLHVTTGFSANIQLPFALIPNKDYVIMCEHCEISEQNENETVLCFPKKFSPDKEQFGKWSERLQSTLRQESSLPFIKDGMNAFERNTKRLVDFFVSGICLVVFSPLFLACYIAVKRDGGPAIYSQERIGRFGRPFRIYKFRSMRVDAEAFGPALFQGEKDDRLTKVGAWLRAHHLDELPQLWNVFCGDMAFVGYRPERQFFIDQITEHDPRYKYLFQIRPGVTSYATLHNGYTDTMEKMLRRLYYDLYYLEHRSWWFDIKVLGATFLSIVFGKKF